MTKIHVSEGFTKKVKEPVTLRSLPFRNAHLKHCVFSGYECVIQWVSWKLNNISNPCKLAFSQFWCMQPKPLYLVIFKKGITQNTFNVKLWSPYNTLKYLIFKWFIPLIESLKSKSENCISILDFHLKFKRDAKYPNF